MTQFWRKHANFRWLSNTFTFTFNTFKLGEEDGAIHNNFCSFKFKISYPEDFCIKVLLKDVLKTHRKSPATKSL